MRTAGDDFRNGTTYLLPTLSVRVALVDKRHMKRALKAPAVTQKQQCSSWHVKGTTWDDPLFFWSHCSGRRPVLGLAEELSAPFPRQRLEPSVLAPQMITKKEGERSLCYFFAMQDFSFYMAQAFMKRLGKVAVEGKPPKHLKKLEVSCGARHTLRCW